MGRATANIAMPYQGGAYGEGCIVPGKVKILKRYTVALPQDEGAEPRAIITDFASLLAINW